MEKDIINKIIRNRKSVYPKDYTKKEIPKKAQIFLCLPENS